MLLPSNAFLTADGGPRQSDAVSAEERLLWHRVGGNDQGPGDVDAVEALPLRQGRGGSVAAAEQVLESILST